MDWPASRFNDSSRLRLFPRKRRGGGGEGGGGGGGGGQAGETRTTSRHLFWISCGWGFSCCGNYRVATSRLTFDRLPICFFFFSVIYFVTVSFFFFKIFILNFLVGFHFPYFPPFWVHFAFRHGRAMFPLGGRFPHLLRPEKKGAGQTGGGGG